MAEYYALLNRAVGALQRNDEASRRDIYVKARSALIKQLKAIDPPLPAAEISKQRLALEDAIRRVEREAVEAAAATMLSEEEISRRAEQALAEALAGGPAPRNTAKEPEVDAVDDDDDDVIEVEPEEEPEDATAFEVVTPVRPRSEGGRTIPSPPPFQRGPKVTDVETVQASMSRGEGRARERDVRGRDRATGRRRERRSAIGQLIWFILVVIIIGGIGYFIWANWDDVSDFIDSLTGNDTSETDDGGAPASAAGVAPVVEQPAETPEPAPAEQPAEEPAPEPSPVVEPVAAFTLVPADPANPPETYDATIRWSLQNGDTDPVIAGNITVPERGLTIALQIAHSADPAFSHELSVLATVTGEGAPAVTSISDFWAKMAEDGNATPLSGEPEVTSDLYFVQLPADAEVQNETRLTLSPWFEIAMVFTSGEEATLSFSKGTVGETVFDEAFAAWDAAPAN